MPSIQKSLEPPSLAKDMSGAALRFFDACAGIGCFHHGMAKAGFTCVGAAELDERLQKEYPKAFKLESSRMFGDLHGITEKEEWKSVREEMKGCVLTAGFPCQPFSKSGTQLGKEHAEGTVFGSLIEVMDDLECPAFILENVENLTGERHGETFEEMKQILRGLNYDIAYDKYSPDQVGIPQHRQRWFIIGVKRADGSYGSENEALLEAMNQVVFSKESKNELDFNSDILPRDSRTGTAISDTEKHALILWDQYLSWLVENPDLGKTPSPLWGMELEDKYDIDAIQSSLHSRSGKKIRMRTIKATFSNGAGKYRKLEDTITKNLPPYLWDLVTRKEPYPDWKPRYIKNSRAHMMKIKAWLIVESRESEWNAWSSKLMAQDATFQKFEWHVREPPAESKSLDDTTRVKKRFKGRLIQFRPSGVRVSKGIRHPALVAIGQVPVVGHWLKRPNWKTLAKLQSIPDDFVKNNKRLFGDSSESGNSGEPIKRLGNAVNVHLVSVIASVVRAELSPAGDD